jgi:hypothetical protein
MATPLLQPLKVQGGTFYTFASAAKDISKTFTDDNARFVFSKYALLDIPKVKTPTDSDNSIVWQALDAFGGGATASSAIAQDFTTDNNRNFAQAFQSYALNFEQLVLASRNNLNETYDGDILATSSERIFWHFLKNVNGIRWQDANTTNESNFGGFYREEIPSAGINYKPVVKYLGDIELINNISKGGQSYSEIYIHVPTSHGNTPLVLFDTSADKNYKPGLAWNGEDDYIYKRSSGFSTFGLNNDAFYDNMATNQYVLGPTFGISTNVGTTAYINSGGGVGTPVPVLISSMEGVKLVFDPENYFPITNNPELDTINDFNASVVSGDFSFNSCLVYYDTYDISNPELFARNLYGILVIDDYENGSAESFLKGFTKFKPNAVTKLNGNSYGLKLNLKFDTSNDNVGVETVIREDLTFGMDLFADASVRLQESADMFLTQKLDLIKIENRVNNLEKYYFSQDTINLLDEKVNALEAGLNNAQLNFASDTTLLDLIRNNSTNINDILTGKVNVNLTYNTDVVRAGDGISIDYSVPNQISVKNKNQEYSTFAICLNTNSYLEYSVGNGIIPGATADGNRILIGPFSNYFRNVGATSSTLFDNLTINLDDTNYTWKKGQTLRIVFENDIDLDTYQINIKTDSQNTKGFGNYGVSVGNLTIADLVTTKPILDIICVDPASYTFYIDVIK